MTSFSFLPTSHSEWTGARLAPSCIVDAHYFANVGVLAGPGGASKTTLLLDQAVCIALGLPLYGQQIKRPGPVAILTGEDDRETLVARLRSVCLAKRLTLDQTQHVANSVRIGDVSGLGLRLTKVEKDAIKPDYVLMNGIVAELQALQPVMLIIDPAVSFGVGESKVNDAEQGLIEAARYIVRHVGCLVLFVHHTGKANARDKTTDQYSGRGGSAFADGARMVHVLQSLTAKEFEKETGQQLEQGETALRLARPKTSFTPPQRDIVIRRKGYHFEHVQTRSMGAEASLAANCDAVWQIIQRKVDAGHYPTQNSLFGMSGELGLSQAQIRQAVAQLKATSRIESRKPDSDGKGGNKSAYLHPIGAAPNEAVSTRQSEARLFETAEN